MALQLRVGPTYRRSAARQLQRLVGQLISLVPLAKLMLIREAIWRHVGLGYAALLVAVATIACGNATTKAGPSAASHPTSVAPALADPAKASPVVRCDTLSIKDCVRLADK